LTISALTIASEELVDGEEVKISEKVFPLEVDLQKTVFNVGDRLMCNASIANNAGRDVFVVSNGYMPGFFFYDINYPIDPAFTMMWAGRTLKANDTMTRAIDFTIVEPPGTYVLEVLYRLEVDGIELTDKLETIIEVK